MLHRDLPAAGARDARPRPDPTRRRVERREGHGSGPPPLLETVRAGPPLRRARADGMAGEGHGGGGPEPHRDLLLMTGESALRLFARHDLALQRANGHIEITGVRTSLRVGPLTSASAAAVQRLFSSPASESELAAGVVDAEGPSALPGFLFLLHHLDAAGVLGRLVMDGARPLASLVPLVEGYRFAPSPAADDRTYRLSRFALLRRQGDDLVLESPLAPALIVIHDPEVASLVHALARPRSLEDLAREVAGVPPDGLCQVLQLLGGAGLTEHGGEEDPTTAPRPWEVHDLLFH